MYPQHTDRARGAITALRDLGLDYPIHDYGEAWNTILPYRAALEGLLQLVRESPTLE